MRKKLNLKKLIPGIILALLLSGCNTGTSPNITSSTPATSEKTPESSDISSVNNSSETPSSDISTASTESSSLNPAISAPQTNSNPATSSETSSSANTSSVEPIQPIKVDKLNQPTKVSITYADTVPGKAVDFEEKTIDISIANDNWTSHIAIIRSYDELKSIYEGEKETFPKDLYIYFERDDYSKMYTEEFFEDKALIMLFIQRGSKSQKYSIASVTKKDNQAFIHIDNGNIPDDAVVVGAIAKFRTFITVAKQDIENITNVGVCRK